MAWADLGKALLDDASQANLALTVLTVLTLVWQVLESLLHATIGSKEVRTLKHSIDQHVRQSEIIADLARTAK